MNVLFLNLTRFGDLLQSQAAISAMAAQGHAVGVVCLENFAGAASMLQGVSHVAPLPGSALLSLVQKSNGTTPGWQEALARLVGWKTALWKAFAPDLVCNLTPALPAQLLALFLSGGVRMSGFTVDENGFGVFGNSWAAFLQGASQNRGVSPFNIVDMFYKMAVAGEEATEAKPTAALRKPPLQIRALVRNMLHKEGPKHGRNFVAFQLGASEERRQWPVESFVALGERLWKEERLCPILLGTNPEQDLAARYRELSTAPCIDLCGKTGLQELAAVLGECSLLVTNDTGTMHLAAGLGRPVLAVFLATAQPFDTGPYAVGSCAVEPDLPCHPCAFGTRCTSGYLCRTTVSAEAVAELALSWCRTGRWLTGCAAPSGARVWIAERGQ